MKLHQLRQDGNTKMENSLNKSESKWEKFKKNFSDSETVKPWHIITKEKVNEEISQKRLDICLLCDRLINLTKQCRECGCIMSAKVKLEKASCPLGKW